MAVWTVPDRNAVRLPALDQRRRYPEVQAEGGSVWGGCLTQSERIN
jgi:hypothetical protein